MDAKRVCYYRGGASNATAVDCNVETTCVEGALQGGQNTGKGAGQGGR